MYIATYSKKRAKFEQLTLNVKYTYNLEKLWSRFVEGNDNINMAVTVPLFSFFFSKNRTYKNNF
jgi:hypothetical protein